MVAILGTRRSYRVRKKVLRLRRQFSASVFPSFLKLTVACVDVAQGISDRNTP